MPETFSGLPEKMAYDVDHSPRLHEGQLRNVNRLFALRRNAPDERICRVARSGRVGDMAGSLGYIARYDFYLRKSEKIVSA
jgi:hypothetical protein